MKLVLHPGHSKCGSTTLQKAIIKNRNLLEGHGYIIPDPQLRTQGDPEFNPNGETPRPFFRHVMEKQDILSLQKKLESIKVKYADKDVSVLISAENLVNQLSHSSGLKIHQTLYKYFEKHKVLYYIRRQDDFIMSAWQQWGYKNGLLLEEFVSKSLITRNPNYKLVSSAFSNIYGHKSVDVIPLESEYLNGSGLLSDFFGRLGISDNKFVKPSSDDDNRSLNPYICESLSKVSFLFKDIHDESIKVRLNNLSKNHSALFMKSNSYLSASLRNKIESFYQLDNQFIEDNFIEGTGWGTIRDNAQFNSESDLLEAAAQSSHVLAEVLANFLSE